MDDTLLSLIGQLGSLVLAGVVGRLLFTSRDAIWVISVLGTLGAMAALIAVDGQGAFLYVLLVPLIYAIATAGRKDLDGGHDPDPPL